MKNKYVLIVRLRTIDSKSDLFEVRAVIFIKLELKKLFVCEKF